AGREGDGGAGGAGVAVDGDVVAGDELVGVAHQHVRELEVRADGLLVEPLDDLQDGQVVGGVAGHVPRPEHELGRLVGEGRVGDEDRVPVVVPADPQVADHVV